MKHLFQEIRGWCRNNNWAVRAPLLLFYFYIFYKHLRNPLYFSMIDYLNLGIHELGHILFGYLGEFIGVLGGTIMQLLVPLYSFYEFYRQKDFFAWGFSFIWIASNLFNISTYIADARTMRLQLVSFGVGDIKHDWNYILGRLGFLRLDTEIASFFRLAAILFMAMGVGFSVYLLLCMYNSQKEKAPAEFNPPEAV